MWIDSFEDTKVDMNVELIRRIEVAISYSHADVVYTHPLGDTHHDHRAVAEATLEAGRFVPNILSYEMPVTKDFSPHVYYDISDVINDKVELLSIFSSQQHKMFICANATRGLAQYRALQSRLHPLVTSAEAYQVLKLGIGTDFCLLTTNSNGFAQGGHVFTPADLAPFKGTTAGVVWTLVSDGVVAYEISCIFVTID